MQGWGTWVEVSSQHFISAAPSFSCCSCVVSLSQQGWGRDAVLHRPLQFESFTHTTVLQELLQYMSSPWEVFQEQAASVWALHGLQLLSGYICLIQHEVLHPWRYSRSALTGLWDCLLQRGWTRWALEVLSDPNHSMITKIKYTDTLPYISTSWIFWSRAWEKEERMVLSRAPPMLLSRQDRNPPQPAGEFLLLHLVNYSYQPKPETKFHFVSCTLKLLMTQHESNALEWGLIRIWTLFRISLYTTDKAANFEKLYKLKFAFSWFSLK